MKPKEAIVIGAGIAGLATARALAIKGYKVKVLERSARAVGASIRNFGMVWPVGQPCGEMYERAVRSRNIWKEIGNTSNCWYENAGSLHLAYADDEWQVLQELFEIFRAERPVTLLEPEGVHSHTKYAQPAGLRGGLFSADEIIVDPRTAISLLPAYLYEQYGIEFFWGKCVTYISGQTAYVGLHEEFQADLVFICSGADFETLYPEIFSGFAITRCKLQMMRMHQPSSFQRLGPALCGGLSLAHYNSFKAAPSLSALRHRFQEEMPQHMQCGVHVMVSQNEKGELTVGDSHEYGPVHDPFDKHAVNQMILDYLKTFCRSADWAIMETWNGVYAKLTDGSAYIFHSPEPGVYIFNGLGGAGMTLSFGLAEELTASI
jgi:FAD dependent oxidoreductase TIGR03364